MELSIPLSKKNEPLFRQVYKGLRKAILSWVFPAGIVVGSIELSETGDSLLHHCLYLRVV